MAVRVISAPWLLLAWLIMKAFSSAISSLTFCICVELADLPSLAPLAICSRSMASSSCRLLCCSCSFFCSANSRLNSAIESMTIWALSSLIVWISASSILPIMFVTACEISSLIFLALMTLTFFMPRSLNASMSTCRVCARIRFA